MNKVSYILISVVLFVFPLYIKASVFYDGNIAYSLEEFDYECIDGEIFFYDSNFNVIYHKSINDDDLYKANKDGCVKMSDQEILDFYNKEYYSGLLGRPFMIKDGTANIERQKFFMYITISECDKECIDKGFDESETYYNIDGSVVINPNANDLSSYYILKTFKYPNSVKKENVSYYDVYKNHAKASDVDFNNILRYRILADESNAYENIATVKIDKSKYKGILDKGYVIANELYYNEFTKKGFVHLISVTDIKIYDTDGKEVGAYDEVFTISPSLIMASKCDRVTCKYSILNNEYKVLYDEFEENSVFFPQRYGDYITYGFINERLVKLYEYRLLSGDNQTFSGKDLTFKFSAPVDRVSKIYVKGTELDKDSYKLESGSTILKLKKEYLETLEDGKYNLKIEYVDTATNNATFNISFVNPPTGDNIVIYVIVATLSIAGIAAAIVYNSKRKS